MDKEKLQQGLAEYDAKVAKATAKFPADDVPRTPVDNARLCRFRHGGRNQRPL